MKTKELISLFILTTFVILLLQSCFKCNDNIRKKYGFSDEFKAYTAMYKPGNWWVYKNLDGTKQDSIYVTDYKDSLVIYKEPCQSFPIVKFNLHSDFFLDTFVKASFIHSEFLNGYGLEVMELFIEGQQKAETTLNFSAKDAQIQSLVEKEYLFNGFRYLGYVQNTPEELRKGLFIENIGLVIYATANDTFVLDRYIIH